MPVMVPMMTMLMTMLMAMLMPLTAFVLLVSMMFVLMLLFILGLMPFMPMPVRAGERMRRFSLIAGVRPFDIMFRLA